MTTQRSTSILLAVAAALSLLLAACGVEASSDSAAVPVATAPSTTAAETSPTTEAESPTTEAERETTTTQDTDTTIPSLPPGMEETFKEQLEIGFKAAGLTDEQAACLADGYLEQFGADPGAATDPTQMLDLFTDCDISPSDLGALNGGGG